MLCVFLNGMCPSNNFFIYFFLPGGPGEEPLEFLPLEVPERNPWNFFPRRSRRGTLETLLLVFFSSSSFVVRRVSMGILETDTWPEQDHKRESTLAQTFEWWTTCVQYLIYIMITCVRSTRVLGKIFWPLARLPLVPRLPKDGTHESTDADDSGDVQLDAGRWDMVPTCAHYVPLGSAGSLFFWRTGAEKEGVKRIKRFMARYLGSSRLPVIRGQSAESTASIDQLRSSWTACRVHRKLMFFIVSNKSGACFAGVPK